MDYEKVTLNGINVYFIKSTNFKVVKMRMSFRNPIVRRNITKNKFMARMLTYSNNKFKAQRHFLMEKQRLYDMGIGSDVYRRGNYLFNDFYLNMIDDKYTETGNFEKGIDLFLTTIFDPNVTSRKFDLESFKVVYLRLKEDIDRLKEDKKAYATRRTKYLMGPKAPYSCVMDGYRSDLDKITPFNLYNYYKKWIKNSLIDIYVAGDIDVAQIKKILQEKIPIEVNYNSEIPLIYNHSKLSKRIRKHFEIDDVKQSNLVLGCKITGLTEYERQYVAPLYNIIFGATPTSKLFSVVREKYSLCYSINSSLDLSSNIMYINAGIDKEKANQTIKLIKKLMSEMKAGNFDAKRLEEAKTLRLEDMKTIVDGLNSLVDQREKINLFNYDDLDVEKEKLTKVSVDDIANVANKIKIDTIFMLRGGDINGNN